MLRREFVEAVVDAVKRLVPYMEVSVTEVVKNNDVTLHGIMIHKPGDSIVPTIYIENYTDKGYMKSDYIEHVNNVAKQIVNDYKEAIIKSMPDNPVELIKDFNTASSMLRLRLVNKKNNAKLFETVPHMPFLDMAIIAVIELESNEDGIATVKVTNDLLKMWGVNALPDILPIAQANTIDNSNYTCTSMASIMSELMGIEIDENEFPIPMYVASNQSKTYGSSVICSYTTMKQISNKFESDLIVLPSSVHEVIIIPKNDDMDIAELTAMVKEVNANEVDATEVLSDHAYIFTRENGWEY